MRKTLLALATVGMLMLPSLAEAQIGIAGRAGTIGVGAEAALAVGSSLVIRGGIGLLPVELDASDLLDEPDVDATLKLPDTWYNIGADLYLGSSFRIGGGMLFKPDDPSITGRLTGTASIDIGGQTYTATDVAEIEGSLVSKEKAPYVLIGFGKHTNSGIGLFLDLGVAFLGEANMELTASGNSTVINSAEFQSRLRAEEQNIEDDLGQWSQYWPILNIGLRIGIGN